MTVGHADPGLAAAVLGNVDLDRAVELVRQVCRIPSVLGDEGELAGFLASVMRESGFGSVELQDVLPSSPATWTPSPSPTAGSGRLRSRATSSTAPSTVTVSWT